MKQIRKLKLRSQTHYALYRADLPFKPKIEKAEIFINYQK